MSTNTIDMQRCLECNGQTIEIEDSHVCRSCGTSFYPEDSKKFRIKNTYKAKRPRESDWL